MPPQPTSQGSGSSSSSSPLRFGLVGAGPWAELFHAPMLARSPDVQLAGVWARRHDQATKLAAKHDAEACADLDDLFDRCDAIAFAVPPDVQSEIAVRAARVGCHLLLEKPLGLDVEQARAVTGAAEASGVISQMVLTSRYRPSVKKFLVAAADFEVHGARVAWIGGGSVAGAYFATPWRMEHGALLDLGPHVLDILEAAVGPITDVRSAGDPTRWTELTCAHANGAVSQASLSITTPIEPGLARFELFGPSGSMVLDTTQHNDDFGVAMAAIPAELCAAVASGRRHALDARHGLHLQELMAAATAQRTT